MTSIPSNLTRVPNQLVSRITLGGLSSTSGQLLRLQSQIATLQRVNRPSDDPVASSLLGVLDQELESSEQYGRNLSHAKSVLGVIDQRIGAINDMVLETKSIASSQLGAGSDSATRASQAAIVDSMLNEVFRTINDDYVGLSLFSGSRAGTPSMESTGTGFRYMGDLSGMYTDLGGGIDFPLTLSADEVLGGLSARMEGSRDLNALVVPETRLSDLRGPMEGVDRLGTITVTVNGGTAIDVDLSAAETVGDVTDILESAIRTSFPGVLAGGFGAGVTIGPAGDRLQVNVTGANTVVLSDGPAGESATALGVAGVTYDLGTSVNVSFNADLDPRVTERTTFAQLGPAVALDLASDLLIRNGNKTGTLSITGATTVGEAIEAVRRLDVGVRMEISDNGNALDLINEVAGPRMSVEETGGLLATTLGLRTVTGATPASIFNDGRGVEIADGEVDENGFPDPFRNVDFEVTLSDGTTFTVDLVESDLDSVSAILARINADAAAAGLTIGTGPGEFRASLSQSTNTIVFEDRLGGPTAISIESLNGYAAEDLGLLDGTSVSGTPSVLVSSDRTGARVDGLFTTLLDLRDSLALDDERGITLAGERLEADLDRLNRARALVGGRTQRIEETERRLEDKTVLDTQIKSELQDLDFLEASSRLTLLQTQLEAAVRSAAQSAPLSLLNFL